MKQFSVFRWTAMALILTVLLGLCACGTGESSQAQMTSPPEQPVPATTESSFPLTDGEASLLSLRNIMKDQGCCLAIAYLGWLNEDHQSLESFITETGAVESFPFLGELTQMRLAACDGADLYLVVPGDADACVTVCDWILSEENDFLGGKGERVFYDSDSGEPFLMTCNVGDIMPNTVISLTRDEKVLLEYSPFLSLMDGSVDIPKDLAPGCGVLDITVYPERDREYEETISQMDSVEDVSLLGQWSGWILPEDERNACGVSFVFYEDGTMEYAFGPCTGGETVLNTYYRGTWEQVILNDPEKPAGGYVFDLVLDPVESGGWGTAPRSLKSTQLITAVYDQLALQLIEGDVLYPNQWESETLLVPAYG